MGRRGVVSFLCGLAILFVGSGVARAGTSDANRARRLVMSYVGGGYAQFGDFWGGMGAIGVGMPVGGESVFGFAANAGVLTGEDKRYQVALAHLAATGQFYLRGSFAVTGGMGVRLLWSAWVRDEKTPELKEISALGLAPIASLALGNHWVFDSGLMLGVDWLGFHGTLGKTIYTTMPFGAEEDKISSKEREQDLMRPFEQRTTILYLKVEVGFAF